MSTNGATERRLCVAADAVSYSKGSDLDQAAVQRDLLEVLDAAATAAGLQRVTWYRQAAGDGELAVLPAGEPEPLVVDRFLRELDAELLRCNAPRRPWARLRLRMAIHFGRLQPAANGFAGPAPVEVSRMVDSVVLHEALRVCPAANLGVLLSSQVFDDTVATLSTTLRPEQLRRVHISSAKFEGDAWLLVPGQDVHSLPLNGSADTGRGCPADGTGGNQDVQRFARVRLAIAQHDLRLHQAEVYVELDRHIVPSPPILP